VEFQPILLPISSMLGVVLGVGLQFFSGRALESRKQFGLQKSQSYVDYFKAIALLAQNGQTKEHLALAADAKVRICLYGSATVIEHLHRFERAGAALDGLESQSIIVDLLKAMRRDIGKIDRELADNAVQRILFRGQAR
jgi:hypothetical protein